MGRTDRDPPTVSGVGSEAQALGAVVEMFDYYSRVFAYVRGKHAKKEN